MHRISSKKLCIGSVVLILAGILAVAAASVVVKNGSGQTFAEEGYILSVDASGDESVISSQSYFSQGSKWNGSNYNTVSYRDASGNTVVVDSDSFLHYNSNAIASLSGGTIVDLDGYLEGKLDSYYIGGGTSLSYDNGQYNGIANGEDLYFENFIWKNSSKKYLFASPVITVTTAGGDKFYLEAGFLEMTYVDDENEIVQLTDGSNAWQVLSDGCVIALDNGVVIDAKSGEVVGDSQSEEETRQTISLGTIAVDAEESIVIGSTTSGKAPEFHFTLINGQDGLNGEDGVSGENGQTGSDGENGEDGEDGEDGADADTGIVGEEGAVGETGTTGAKGEVDPGSTITTAKPTVEAWTWELNHTTLKFSLYYNLDDSADGVVSTDASSANEEAIVSPYFYIYDMETGEKVDLSGLNRTGYITGVVNNFATIGTRLPWASALSGEEGEEINPATVDGYAEYTVSNLELNKVYCLTVIGTYALSGTDYTTKVMERVFTTNGTGVSVSLSNRVNNTDGSSNVNFTVSSDKSGKEEIKINSVTVNYDGLDAAKTYRVDNAGSESFSNTLTGLASNTKYTFTFWTEYTTYQDGKETGTATDETKIEWTTLKQTPKLQGLSLVSEDGYLLATAYGKYTGANTSTGGYEYINSGSADGSDPDGALTGITFTLYENPNNSGLVNQLKKVKSETTTSDHVYFKVDGSTIQNGVNYYLMAEYTYNDGSVDTQMSVMEGNKDITTVGDVVCASANGKAIAYAMAKRSSDVSISFSGKGSGLYNNQDGEEGISYNAIRGSLLVTLNGTIIRVNNNHKLSMVVTDHRSESRTFTYDNCGGKKGNIQGSFALSIDLEGLDAENTYSVTLYAQVYDSNEGTYSDETSIGTVILKTAAADQVSIGIGNAQTRSTNKLAGVGVYFWLGSDSNNMTNANGLPNYYVYDEAAQKYVYQEQYLKSVSASYRSLKTLVLQLYNGENLIGECDVEVSDDQGNVIDFDPEESPLYQKYYGSSAFGGSASHATVGVGGSYEYNFKKVDQNGIPTSTTLQTSDIESYPTQEFTIKVVKAYDLYVNELPITKEEISIVYEERPGADPAELVDSNNVAIRFETLLNENEGADRYTEEGKEAEKFDEKLLDETVVGIQLNLNDAVSSTKKRSNLYGASTITFYGTTQTLYNSGWSEEKALDAVKDKPDIIPFKFTVTYADTIGKDDVAPTLKLLTYEGSDEWSAFFADDNNHAKAKQESDRGYDYYIYDEADNTYIIYIDSNGQNAFFTRGNNYIFAYDAVIPYLGEDFAYPSSYYSNGWVSNSLYQKSTALKSAVISINSQEPAFYPTWISSTPTYEQISAANSSSESKGTETWNVKLDDPDSTMIENSLYGYVDKDVNVGGMYSAVGTASPLYSVPISFSLSKEGLAGQYTLSYKTNADGRMVAEIKKDNITVQATEPVFTAMIEAMKSEAGLDVTFSNLDLTGVRYCWQAAYQQNKEGTVAQTVLVYRYYVGPYKLTGTDESTNDADQEIPATLVSTANKKLTYQIQYETDKVTNEKMTVYFEPTGTTNASEEDMRNDFSRVAMVEIRAFNGQTPIKKKTEDGDTTTYDEDMVSYAAISYDTSLKKYAFTFKITDFDTAQFGDSKEATFQFTFYYDSGDVVTLNSSGGLTDADTGYYTLRSMTKKGTTSTPYYLSSNTETTPQTAAFQAGASGAVYTLSSAAQSGTKPVVRTYELNDRFVYKENKKFASYGTRTEYLDFRKTYDASGTVILNSYSSVSEGVTELIRLSAVTCKVKYTLNDILPYASSFTGAVGLGTANITLKVDNYDLLDYTGVTVDGNNNTITQMPIRCVLYKEVEKTESGKKTKVREDKTVAVCTAYGEAVSESGASITTAGLFTANVTGLEDDTTYRVYFYYLDKSGKWADLTYGGSNEANMTLDEDPPTLGEGYAERGNTKVYYGTFKTKDGVEITSMIFGTSFGTNAFGYKTIESAANAGTTNVWDSGRTITATIETKFNQEGLRVAFVLERRKIGSTKDSDWQTIMMDKNLSALYDGQGNTATSGYNKDLYSTLWSTEHPILYAKASDFVTFNDYTKGEYTDGDIYNKNQALEAKEDTTSTYTKTVKFTYYPGGPIKQGYQYRMKALLFLTDAKGNMNELVSLDSANHRYRAYASSWEEYEYSDTNTLFVVSDMSVTNEGDDASANKHQLTVTVSRRKAALFTQVGMLDGTYYIRLAKKDAGGAWVVVSDPQYYGTSSLYEKKSIFYTAFPSGSTSYTLTFTNLEPQTEYRLQFYGLVDTDNDNYINIAYNGTYLAGNDTQWPLFKLSNKTAVPSTANTLNNNYASIYSKYFSVESSSKLNEYSKNNEEFFTAEASKVMLCASGSVTTLADGQRTTLGTKATIDKDKDGILTIKFYNTSGLEHIASCDAELIYDSDEGDIWNLSSGVITISKADGVNSIMDNGDTGGTVTLTIKDPGNDLLNWSKYKEGTYRLILYFYDESSTDKKNPTLKYDSQFY